MPSRPTNHLQQIQELQEKLAEAEETLTALRNGEVDAFVGSGPAGECIYTLKGADEAYRQIVEGMSEGAVTLGANGRILFANRRFAILLAVPLEHVIGTSIRDFVSAEYAGVVGVMLSDGVE